MTTVSFCLVSVLLFGFKECLDRFYNLALFPPCHCHIVSMTPILVMDDRVPVPGTSDGINLLGLLVFSIAFGLVLARMGTEGKLLRDFFDCLNKVMMRLVSLVIWEENLLFVVLKISHTMVGS